MRTEEIVGTSHPTSRRRPPYRRAGNTPLIIAAFTGADAVLTLLLNAGASVTASNTTFGWPPLTAAACKGFATTVTALLCVAAPDNTRDFSVSARALIC